MANEWNVSYPVDHTKIGDVPGEIRKLKDSAKDQLSHEHQAPVDGDATGSEHTNGSAVAYVGAATPTNRPDGVTALADNDIDDGRLWLNDTAAPATLKRWKDSAFAEVKTLGGWTPSAYAGEESITFPNGMIIKQGAASYSGSALAVTFAVAFPTDCLSIQVSLYKATYAAQYGPQITAKAVTGFTVNHGAYTGVTVYWMAIGY